MRRARTFFCVTAKTAPLLGKRQKHTPRRNTVVLRWKSRQYWDSGVFGLRAVRGVCFWKWGLLAQRAGTGAAGQSAAKPLGLNKRWKRGRLAKGGLPALPSGFFSGKRSRRRFC